MNNPVKIAIQKPLEWRVRQLIGFHCFQLFENGYSLFCDKLFTKSNISVVVLAIDAGSQFNQHEFYELQSYQDE